VKRISILGATGSIGQSTLDVVRNHADQFSVTAVAAGSDWKGLAKIIEEFNPDLAAIYDEEAGAKLKKSLKGNPCTILQGEAGVIEAASTPKADMLVSAAVGASGLRPTIAAIEAGLDIALANKETLVMAGSIVKQKVAETGVQLLPVDSEHSALFQCLQCGRYTDVTRLILTASGGPFRGKDREALETIKSREALKHPTWEMGPKVTIDSATLVNKALEVIEAHWLFDMDYDMIEVLVHPQSVVHSLVEFTDGSTISHLGPTDMKIPIQYALTYPQRLPSPVPPMDLAAIGSLTFEDPNRTAFPCLDLGYKAGRMGGLAPAIFSSANEVAVEHFLRDEIHFLDIPTLIANALKAHTPKTDPTLEDILEADRWAREQVTADISALLENSEGEAESAQDTEAAATE
jgi:1-deoxy-D-xylulose-5-phosphate reductoisomerase